MNLESISIPNGNRSVDISSDKIEFIISKEVGYREFTKKAPLYGQTTVGARCAHFHHSTLVENLMKIKENPDIYKGFKVESHKVEEYKADGLKSDEFLDNFLFKNTGFKDILAEQLGSDEEVNDAIADIRGLFNLLLHTFVCLQKGKGKNIGTAKNLHPVLLKTDMHTAVHGALKPEVKNALCSAFQSNSKDFINTFTTHMTLRLKELRTKHSPKESYRENLDINGEAPFRFVQKGDQKIKDQPTIENMLTQLLGEPLKKIELNKLKEIATPYKGVTSKGRNDETLEKKLSRDNLSGPLTPIVAEFRSMISFRGTKTDMMETELFRVSVSVNILVTVFP